ncbi:hypothetical protein GCM10007205_17880 [Oxalicibacterium flavum]|uniref:Uncharacterized protein n=1 Tax=Oxalicibacterium flavum TaxID=179467 RepID=A0A8J2XXD0_9BURK|nr:hypothetical protein [Oxalicibacterium flavum]GGC09149.1 hypothetical protein GCM10007205_17880 [Oxalicibacterium flavum]
MTKDSPNLFDSCKAVARQVLLKNGKTSNDVIETLAEKFLAIAETHQDFIRRQRESDDVIAYAVQYIADVHAILPMGTDTAWFTTTLATLLELAVPNSAVTDEAAPLLPCIQQGIREALSSIPISRGVLRLYDEDAESIRRLQDAGVEHGIACNMQELLEKLFHGDPLTHDDEHFFYLVAIGAPFTRQKRSTQGLDSD